jgi:hypothetical protein
VKAVLCDGLGIGSRWFLRSRFPASGARHEYAERPDRVFTTHRADQFPNLLRNARPPRRTAPNLPGPAETEALAVPANHRGRFDDEDAGPPFLPDRRQPGPQ